MSKVEVSATIVSWQHFWHLWPARHLESRKPPAQIHYGIWRIKDWKPPLYSHSSLFIFSQGHIQLNTVMYQYASTCYFLTRFGLPCLPQSYSPRRLLRLQLVSLHLKASTLPVYHPQEPSSWHMEPHVRSCPPTQGLLHPCELSYTFLSFFQKRNKAILWSRTG